MASFQGEYPDLNLVRPDNISPDSKFATDVDECSLNHSINGENTSIDEDELMKRQSFYKENNVLVKLGLIKGHKDGTGSQQLLNGKKIWRATLKREILRPSKHEKSKWKKSNVLRRQSLRLSKLNNSVIEDNMSKSNEWFFEVDSSSEGPAVYEMSWGKVDRPYESERSSDVLIKYLPSGQKTKRPNHYGAVPGIRVGDKWDFRKDCSESGVHRPNVARVHSGPHGAYSVVLCDAYNGEDNGEKFTFPGTGGIGKSYNTPMVKDQTLTQGNAALVRSIQTKKPVRVVRGAIKSLFAPSSGYRYDGLYEVELFWTERNSAGFLIYKFGFRRCFDQASPPWDERKQKIPVTLSIGSQIENGTNMLNMQLGKAKNGVNEISLNNSNNRKPHSVVKNGIPSDKKPYFYGRIEGVKVGQIWEFRMGCCDAGVHRPHGARIHAGPEGAYSIVLSDPSVDTDQGDSFTYIGTGGRVKQMYTLPQVKNQKFIGGNFALANNIQTKQPVRVVRGPMENNPYAPISGYRYDGLYQVNSYWTSKSSTGFLVYKFSLSRCPGQEKPPWKIGGKASPIKASSIESGDSHTNTSSPKRNNTLVNGNGFKLSQNNITGSPKTPTRTSSRLRRSSCGEENVMPNGPITNNSDLKTPSKIHSLVARKTPQNLSILRNSPRMVISPSKGISNLIQTSPLPVRKSAQKPDILENSSSFAKHFVNSSNKTDELSDSVKRRSSGVMSDSPKKIFVKSTPVKRLFSGDENCSPQINSSRIIKSPDSKRSEAVNYISPVKMIASNQKCSDVPAQITSRVNGFIDFDKSLGVDALDSEELPEITHDGLFKLTLVEKNYASSSSSTKEDLSSDEGNGRKRCINRRSRYKSKGSVTNTEPDRDNYFSQICAELVRDLKEQKYGKKQKLENKESQLLLDEINSSLDSLTRKCEMEVMKARQKRFSEKNPVVTEKQLIFKDSKEASKLFRKHSDMCSNILATKLREEFCGWDTLDDEDKFTGFTNEETIVARKNFSKFSEFLFTYTEDTDHNTWPGWDTDTVSVKSLVINGFVIADISNSLQNS